MDATTQTPRRLVDCESTVQRKGMFFQSPDVALSDPTTPTMHLPRVARQYHYVVIISLAPRGSDSFINAAYYMTRVTCR